MKKIISLLLVIALTAAIAIGGTLAYLTDRDSEANVFTVGDVNIRLDEEFQDGATLIPGVDIEKEPTITNTGKNDAWVWATIAIPAAFDNEDASKNVIHFNYSKESVADGLWNWQGDDGWMIETVTYEEVEYNVYTVLYETALKPGETTAEPVMTKVYMDDHVDIDPEGNVYHVENGVAEPVMADDSKQWNVNDYGNPVIYVSAYAIQTEGFETVLDAYNAYTEQWTTDAGVNNGVEWGTPAKVATDAAGIQDALAAKEDVILEAGEYVMPSLSAADGLTITGADGAKVVPAEGSSNALSGTINNATLKNLTFEGDNAARWTYTKGDVVFDDCVFQGDVYGYHVDGANNGTITFNNCTFVGFNAFAATGTYYFNNCTFVHSGSYGHTNMWGTGYFTDCDFQTGTSLSGAGSSSNVYIDGVLVPDADFEY